MEIKINLNEILGDESGIETLEESVRRQVVDGITRSLSTAICPNLINNLLDAEYVVVDRYGYTHGDKKTNFRKALLEKLVGYKMKQFKLGDRVAFCIDGGTERHKGVISYSHYGYTTNRKCIKSGEDYIDLKDCTNIKRLVKKKRQTIWVNEYAHESNYLGAVFKSLEQAIKFSKLNENFIRTIKFKECK